MIDLKICNPGILLRIQNIKIYKFAVFSELKKKFNQENTINLYIYTFYILNTVVCIAYIPNDMYIVMVELTVGFGSCSSSESE